MAFLTASQPELGNPFFPLLLLICFKVFLVMKSGDRRHVRHLTIAQFGEASSSLKVITSPVRLGSRGDLFGSSHSHRRAFWLLTGQRVVWDLINIFKFDDQGRLVEEWVRTDYRSFLRQLGAQGQ